MPAVPQPLVGREDPHLAKAGLLVGADGASIADVRVDHDPLGPVLGGEVLGETTHQAAPQPDSLQVGLSDEQIDPPGFLTFAEADGGLPLGEVGVELYEADRSPFHFDDAPGHRLGAVDVTEQDLVLGDWAPSVPLVNFGSGPPGHDGGDVGLGEGPQRQPVDLDHARRIQ